MNNAAMNICGHIFGCTYVRISVGVISRSVISVHNVYLHSVLVDIAKEMHKVFAPVYSLISKP